MVSILCGNRELFYLELDSRAGETVYIDRPIQSPDGGWTRVTKVVLNDPVAYEVDSRAPLFDMSTCQVSSGW